MRFITKVSIFISATGLTLSLLSNFGFSAPAQPDYAELKRGVVKIVVTKNGNELETGTGIVVGIDGNIALIVTALHVVTFQKDGRFTTAERTHVVFYDKPYVKFKGSVFDKYDSALDMAVIVVSPEQGRKIPSDLPSFTLGDISALVEGNNVTTIGHPLDYEWEVQIENNTVVGLSALQDHRKFRFTKVGVERGHSGGPVFNGQSQLIGMITERHPSHTIAVKMNEVLSLLKEWRILTSKVISPPPVAQLTAPRAPTDLKAALTGNKEVRLGWADNADNESGFKVMRRVGGESQFREYRTVGKNQNLFVDKDADRPGTDYQYMIQAFNDAGKSLPSNMASVKIPLTRPEAPADLRAQAVGPTEVKLAWKDTADNERGIRIERRAGTEGAFRVIDTLGPNQESFFDKRVRPGAKYEYRVRAFNEGGESAYSRTALVRMANPTWATASGFLAMVKAGKQFVDDISGLKICGSTRSLDYLRESTGVKDFTPIVIAGGEAYMALQRGVCEAVVVYMDDPKKLYEFYNKLKLNEVAPHLILLP